MLIDGNISSVGNYVYFWLNLIDFHNNSGCGEFFKYPREEAIYPLGAGRVSEIPPIKEQKGAYIKQFTKAQEIAQSDEAPLACGYYREDAILRYVDQSATKNERKHAACGECKFCQINKLYPYSVRHISRDTKNSRDFLESEMLDFVIKDMLLLDQKYLDEIWDTVQEAITAEKYLFDTFGFQNIKILRPLRYEQAMFYEKCAAKYREIGLQENYELFT